MPIRIHRERDRLMTHDLLDYLGVSSCHRQPGTACVPQAMKIKHFPFVINRCEKIALFSLVELLGILFCLRQPLVTGVFQVIPEHPGDG